MHINFHKPTQDYIMSLIFLYLVFVLVIWRLCDTVIENLLFFSGTHKYFLGKCYCSFERKLVQFNRTSLLKTHVYILSFCYTYLATCGAIEVLSYTLTTHYILTKYKCVYNSKIHFDLLWAPFAFGWVSLESPAAWSEWKENSFDI